MIGVILNSKYQLQKLIAESTGYDVYLAVEGETGTEVVVKIMGEEQARNEERVAVFSNEVKKYTCLAHPALAQILDFDVWEGRPYLVSERIEGVDVRSVIKSGNLSFEEILRVVAETGEVIYHAFEQGVTPRYLKQSNIFRCPKGRTRILSFSIPRLKLVGTGEGDTQSGVQADLFFLGTLMYELLTGESPIRRRGGINELWDTRVTQALRLKFEHLEPALIDKVVEIIDKTFTREVKTRYTDHLGFLRDLRELGKAGRVKGASAPAPRRASFATASEVVDAIHGRGPSAMNEMSAPANEGAGREFRPAEAAVLNPKSGPFGHADLESGFSTEFGNAVAARQLEPGEFSESQNLRPALKVLKGGRSGEQNGALWRGSDDHVWYRHPMLMMGFGLALMIVLILFW